MAASLLGRLFHSNPSSHDNDINFPHGDLNVPPNSPTTQLHSPSSQSCSRSSSPSIVQHMETPEHTTSSSAIRIDEQLSDPELPRSIDPHSNAGQSNQELQPSTTSKGKDYNPIPSQNIHQHSITHFHPTLVLQNKGSVARDHLASERTFLAYVRTSLGMASAGVALIQLFTMADLVSKSTGVPLPDVNQKLQKFAAPLGLSAVGMAIIVLLIGELLFYIFMISSILIFYKKKVLLGISGYRTLFRRISSQLHAYLLCSSLLASVRLRPSPLEPFLVGRFHIS